MKRYTVAASWVVLGVALAAALLCLPTLPNQIPIHWNAAGEIDGWGGRLTALLLPAVGLGLNLLFALLPKIDPRRKNYAWFDTAYGAFRLIFALFWLGLVLFTLVSAYRPAALTGRLLLAAVGALFCGLGACMPRFAPNYFVGIRTPWTLDSETVWRRTHLLGGRIWFFGGLVWMPAGLLLPSSFLLPALAALIVLLAIVPCAASYLYWRRDGGKSD